MTEHGYTGPPTMTQLQAQLKEIRTILQDVLNALPKQDEGEGAPTAAELKRRLLEHVKKGLTGPLGVEAAIQAVQDPESIEKALETLDHLPHRTRRGFGDEQPLSNTAGAKTFEQAMGQFPRRHLGRPTEEEAKAEADLAERLRKLYKKRVLK